MALRLRVGAEQAETARRQRRPRTPDLLTVELPATLDLGRSGSKRGEVAARLGLWTRPGPRSLPRWPSSAACACVAVRCRGRTTWAPASRCRWRWPGPARRPGSTPLRRRSTAAGWRRGRRTPSGQAITRGRRRKAPCPNGDAARSPRRCRTTRGKGSRFAARKSRTSARNSWVASSNVRSINSSLQQRLDHLAARIARQHVEELHRSRDLEVRQVFARVGDHGFFVQRRAGRRHDERLADLAEPLVGNPDDRGFGDAVSRASTCSISAG